MEVVEFQWNFFDFFVQQCYGCLQIVVFGVGDVYGVVLDVGLDFYFVVFDDVYDFFGIVVFDVVFYFDDLFDFVVVDFFDFVFVQEMYVDVVFGYFVGQYVVYLVELEV